MTGRINPAIGWTVRPRVTTARRQPAGQRPPRLPPKARTTAATPKSAPLLCSTGRRLWIWMSIGRMLMVLPQRSRNRQGKRAPSRYSCPSPPLQPAGEPERLLARPPEAHLIPASLVPMPDTAAGKERGAASAAPQTRINQGKKLGDGVGRNFVGTGTLLLNRPVKEARGQGAVGGNTPPSRTSESPNK